MRRFAAIFIFPILHNTAAASTLSFFFLLFEFHFIESTKFSYVMRTIHMQPYAHSAELIHILNGK